MPPSDTLDSYPPLVKSIFLLDMRGVSYRKILSSKISRPLFLKIIWTWQRAVNKSNDVAKAFDNYEISKGTVYLTLEDAKEAVYVTIVARGGSLKVRKSDKKKLVAICQVKNCFFLNVCVSDVKWTGVITIHRTHVCLLEVHADWLQACSVQFKC